jgi:oligopeptide/dipeptide ABC transporter ATP-binding protein
MSAVPRMTEHGMRRSRIIVGGDVPSPISPPQACVFHPRCPRFQRGHCDVEPPPLAPVDSDTHEVACHYPLERWPMTLEEIRRPAEPLEVRTAATG